jgi:hypothetical protein
MVGPAKRRASPCGLVSLGAIAQRAILPGKVGQ